MILIDSNIPMYLVGAAHPHKSDAQRLLERLALDNRRQRQKLSCMVSFTRRPNCTPTGCR